MKRNFVGLLGLALAAAGAIGLGGCVSQQRKDASGSARFGAPCCKVDGHSHHDGKCCGKAPEPIVRTEYVTVKEPCATSQSGAINMPEVKVVVETVDNVTVTRVVTACGPDGKAVVGTATTNTTLVNGQTVTVSGNGHLTSTSTATPGGTCDTPTQAPPANK